MTANPETTVTCRCGQVAFQLTGKPIVAVVCHCDDCQRASRELESLPGAVSILDSAGGTPYVMHPRHGAQCVRGGDCLVDHVIANEANTKRVVAGPKSSGLAPISWAATGCSSSVTRK